MRVVGFNVPDDVGLPQCPASDKSLDTDVISYIFFLFCLCEQKFPELKFKYVEEDQPEDFFIPYVWSLVFNSGVGLYWNPHGIELFSMDSG